MTNNKHESNVTTINYIVEYSEGQAPRVQAALRDYSPKVSSLIDVLTVSVSREQEQSLLEVLASVPGITYHQAAPRKTFKDGNK